MKGYTLRAKYPDDEPQECECGGPFAVDHAGVGPVDAVWSLRCMVCGQKYITRYIRPDRQGPYRFEFQARKVSALPMQKGLTKAAD